jgi:hypothetical protein
VLFDYRRILFRLESFDWILDCEGGQVSFTFKLRSFYLNEKPTSYILHDDTTCKLNNLPLYYCIPSYHRTVLLLCVPFKVEVVKVGFGLVVVVVHGWF